MVVLRGDAVARSEVVAERDDRLGPVEPSSGGRDGERDKEKSSARRWLVDVAIGVMSSLVVGLLLAAYQARIDDARESQAQAIEASRAERDEVLANVQFIRETIRDAPEGAKPFRGMNLRGADLSGIDLGCPVRYDEAEGWTRVRVETCADFTGADLTGARLDGANLTGALLVDGSLRDVSAVNLFAPSAEIGGVLDGSAFDGALLFGSVFRSPSGTSSFVDANLDGVQVDSGSDEGSTFTLTRVSMTGFTTVGDGMEIDCQEGFAQASRGNEMQRVAGYTELSDGGRIACGAYGERCDFDRFPQAGAELVNDGVWKMPATGCAESASGKTPGDTPPEQVIAFYNDLLPGWTRNDIALAEIL